MEQAHKPPRKRKRRRRRRRKTAAAMPPPVPAHAPVETYIENQGRQAEIKARPTTPFELQGTAHRAGNNPTRRLPKLAKRSGHVQLKEERAERTKIVICQEIPKFRPSRPSEFDPGPIALGHEVEL